MGTTKLQLQVSQDEIKNKAKSNKTQSQSSADQKQNSLQDQNSLNQNKFTSIDKSFTYFQFFENIQKQTQETSTQQTLSANEKSIFYQFIDNFSNLKNQHINENEETKENFQINRRITTIFSKLQLRFQIQIEKLILKSQKFKKINFFTKDLKIHEIQTSKSSQIIKVELHLHWYKVEITILNQMQKIFPFRSSQISSSGSFGSIFLTKVFEEFIAIKCISIEKLEQLNRNEVEYNQKLTKTIKIVMNALKEFFFVLLFSQLRIGPQAKTIQGFDIVIYQNSIAFATQICSKFKFNQDINDLKSSLFRMHMLQIVHRDIKPTNIMYSAAYKKNVFIDFGCAQVLDTNIGQKSMAQFIGTPSFCSGEVLLLLTNKNKAADLYFNDVFGLNKCNEQFLNQTLEIKENEVILLHNNEVELLSLRFELYSANDELFLQKWKLIIRQYPQSYEQIQKQVLLYLRNTKPRYLLRHFYQQQISENIKELPEFQDMQLYMKDQNSLLLYYLNPKEGKTEKISVFELLFKRIAIEFSCFTENQKEIYLRLLNKETASKYIFELITKLESDGNLQKISSENKDFVALCLVVAYYCSLVDNPLQISIDEKVKVCKEMVEFIRKIHPKLILSIQTSFQCPIELLKPVYIFSQFFLFKVLELIPFKDQYSLMTKIVGNLCLLGIPFNQSQKLIEYFTYKLIVKDYVSKNEKTNFCSQNEQINDIQRIILFWELKNCLLIFKNVFYDKTTTIFKINEQSEICESIIVQNKEFMALKRTKNNLFFEINYKLYNIICSKQKEELNENDIEQLFKSISSIEIQKNDQFDKLIKSWKKTLCVSICHLIVDQRIKKVSSIEKLFEKERVLDYYFERGHLRSQLVLFYWDKIYNSNVNISLILREIDKIIGYPKISWRLEMELRYEVALNIKDFKTLENMGYFIYTSIGSKLLTISNAKILKSLISQAFKSIFIFIQAIPTPNLQFHSLLHACQPIVLSSIELGSTWIQKCILFRKLSENILKDDMDDLLTINYIKSQIDHAEIMKSFCEILLNIGYIYLNFGNLGENMDFELSPQKILTIFQHNHLTASSINFRTIYEKMLYYCSSKYQQTYIESLKFSHFKCVSDHFFSHITKNLYSQEYCKYLIRTNKDLAISFGYILITYPNNFQENLEGHQIIKEVIGDFSQSQLIEFTANLNFKTFGISYEYIKFQILQTKYEPFWCQQFITLYRICRNNDFIKSFFEKYLSIRILFECFIYTKKPFKFIKQFFIYMALIIKRSPKKELIKIVRENLNSMLCCLCANCFPRQPEGWDPYRFIRYLYERIKEEIAEDNPYMALIYFQSMKNKYLPAEINRAFVMYILRSMNYLVLPAKQQILTELHQHVYSSIYRDQVKSDHQLFLDGGQEIIKQFFISSNILHRDKQQVRLVLKSNGKTQALKINQKEVKINRVKKCKMNSKSNRKFIYYYTQTLKNKSITQNSLQTIINQRFFREDSIQDYFYPSFIRKMYAKKIQRYHLVKQNYQRIKQFSDLHLPPRTHLIRF